MTTATTHTLDVPGATLTYDIRGPIPTADGQPVLLLIGHPMDASGFGTLASYFPDRTVVTYDPRGIGRSTLTDEQTPPAPAQQSDDLHRLVAQLGPVDLFGSSGGAVNGMRLVSAHPADVRTFVAHEPPILSVLPDATAAFAATRAVQDAYHQRGWGAGMAAFFALTSWQGEFTDDFASHLPEPAAFGLPTDDDGSRSDPLLSGANDDTNQYQPDIESLTSAPTRVVVAAGIESRNSLTWRTSAALAEALGLELAVFPSNHGGFLGDEFGQPGQPEAFATRLREVLASGQ